jgi:hypothetical protein
MIIGVLLLEGTTHTGMEWVKALALLYRGDCALRMALKLNANAEVGTMRTALVT